MAVASMMAEVAIAAAEIQRAMCVMVLGIGYWQFERFSGSRPRSRTSTGTKSGSRGGTTHRPWTSSASAGTSSSRRHWGPHAMRP